MKHTSKYFYGHEISPEGLKNKRVDYRTMAQCFDAVLNNNIMQKMQEAGYYFESENEFYYEDNDGNIYETENEAQEAREELEAKRDTIEDNWREAYENDAPNAAALEKELDEINENIEALEEPKYKDIFQFYIVSDNAIEILREAGETIFYCEALDLYIWGVDHWGTSWDYVMTNIKLDIDEE